MTSRYRYSALAVYVLLAACRVGPRYQQPAALPAQPPPPPAYKESPTQFKDTDGWKVASPQDAMLRGKWWEIFKDPELNALEEQLTSNNQSIKQSYENYMAARALIREARSQLFPTVSISPSMTGSRSSNGLFQQGLSQGQPAQSVVAPSSTASISQFYSLPLELSWEPDLWGRVRNAIREAQYNAQVSAADLENEKLVEQASLAMYYFQIRGQDALQQVLNETVEANKKTLELTQSLYNTGIDTQISVVQAKNALQNAEAGAITVGVARAQYEHAIAALVGRAASTFSIPTKSEIVAPPPIPVGVPSQLLERRPDVAAAERTMAAANAQIGIAYAAYYPNLTLSAAAGFESSSITRWLTWPSRFWSAGPSVAETIFDAGLRRATVNQYVATYNADVASYRQTVLTAFQQVEDYLAALRILSQQVLKLNEAVQSAEEYLKLALTRYETGIDPYLNVLTAQTTLLADRQSLLTTQVQESVAAVELIEALGGGWDTAQLPTPEQVSAKPSKAETAIQH